MKKIIIIAAIIAVFFSVVYLFEQGEKDPDLENNEAPSHVKG